ncbi:transmembrane protein, partial [Cystoisospora suis]
MERRVNEFGGTELLNLLLALSRMQVQLPPDKQRKDRKCWGSILKALRRRMAAFGFIQNLQILECVILLNYYDSIFIHTKLLPSLLAKKPSFSSSSSPASQLSFHQGPAGAGTSRGTAEGILSLYLRLLRCLVRLPSLSQTAVQLLQEVVEVLPGTFINGSQGVPAIAEAIHLLH